MSPISGPRGDGRDGAWEERGKNAGLPRNEVWEDGSECAGLVRSYGIEGTVEATFREAFVGANSWAPSRCLLYLMSLCRGQRHGQVWCRQALPRALDPLAPPVRGPGGDSHRVSGALPAR